MAVTSGFNVKIYALSGGTSVCSNDKYSRSGGTTTCTQIKYIDSYSIDNSLETIDVTGFGDRFKKTVAGFPSYTLQFSGGLDLSDSGQLALYKQMTCTASSRVQQVIRVNDGNVKVTHRGWLTGVGTGGSVGGKSTFSATLSPTILPTASASCTVL